MEQIKDYNVYNSRMALGIRDKLFFEGLVGDDVNTFVDFGCANGELLSVVHRDNPQWELYGVDNDAKMQKLCRNTCPEAAIVSNITELSMTPDKTLLNMSSVVHEIYNYLTEDEIIALWDNIFNIGFRYIAIRDIMPQKSIARPADISDVRKVCTRGDSKQISDFTSFWGSLTWNENLVHFLLKYRYKENWKREVREDYFAVTIEDFLKIIPDTYEVVYLHNYILPYTKDIVRRDFGVELRDNTHVKILLKRKK